MSEFAPASEAEGPRPRLLLIRLSAIGDCLHALPVLVELRKRHPRAYIGWALEAAAHGLLEGHPLVDRFHVFPRKAFRRGPGTFLEGLRSLQRFRGELREARYDTALDLQGLTKSGLVAKWSRAARRIGFAGQDSRELNCLFMNTRIAPGKDAVHVVDRNLRLLRPLGIEPPLVASWALPEYAAEKVEMDRFLAERGLATDRGALRFAVLNPGATWATKRWPAEEFGALARGLVKEEGLPVVVTWGNEEELRAAEAIAGGAGGKALVAPPTNLRQLAALLQRAALFVGNDSGPLHLAVALGIPTVAVFGASDPLRNGPYGRHHRVVAKGPECQPCWRVECPRQDRECLRRVRPEQVLTACRELLRESAEARPC